MKAPYLTLTTELETERPTRGSRPIAPGLRTLSAATSRPGAARLWLPVALLALVLTFRAHGQETNSPAAHEAAKEAVESESEHNDLHAQTNDLAAEEEPAPTNETVEISGPAPTRGSEALEGGTEERQTVGASPAREAQVRRPVPQPAAKPARQEASREVERQPQSASASATENVSPSPRPAAASRSRGLEFSAFKIISQNNIFDPNRRPNQPDRPPAPKPKQVDSFALVGVMSYDKGTFAFFDGSSSAYRKVLKLNDYIAGYQVTGISPSSVSLASGTNKVDLRIGMQMSREDEGPWVAGSRTQTYADTRAPDSSSGSVSHSEGHSSGSGGGDALERIRERLRKQREKEE